jgi:hypothetical protein
MCVCLCLYVCLKSRGTSQSVAWVWRSMLSQNGWSEGNESHCSLPKRECYFFALCCDIKSKVTSQYSNKLKIGHITVGCIQIHRSNNNWGFPSLVFHTLNKPSLPLTITTHFTLHDTWDIHNFHQTRYQQLCTRTLRRKHNAHKFLLTWNNTSYIHQRPLCREVISFVDRFTALLFTATGAPRAARCINIFPMN